MQKRRKNNKEQMWLGGALKTVAGGAASLIPGIGPAIGVPLMGAGMGEIGQHFMDKEQQVPQQSMWQPSIQPNYLPTFQGGGDLGMKSNVYADYDVGQDHSGPDEGIEIDAMGQPVAMSGGEGVALTEKGEVSFNGQVFSDKSKLPGHKDKTFADEAKRVVKKYKFYLGEKLDKVHPMSQKALERELSKLFEIQEAKKGNMMHKDEVEQMMQEQQMAMEQQMQQGQEQGMEQGMGQEEQMAQDPMMQQMAMEQQQGGGMPMEEGMPMMRRGGYLPKLSGGDALWQGVPYTTPEVDNSVPLRADWKRTGQAIGTGLVGPIAGLAKSFLDKPQSLNLPRMTANKMNLAPARLAADNAISTGLSGAKRTISRNAPTRGALQAGMVGASAEAARNKADNFTQSMLAEQQYNLQAQSQADQFNLQSRGAEIQDRVGQQRHKRLQQDALLANVGSIAQKGIADHYAVDDFYHALNMKGDIVAVRNPKTGQIEYRQRSKTDYR